MGKAEKDKQQEVDEHLAELQEEKSWGLFCFWFFCCLWERFWLIGWVLVGFGFLLGFVFFLLVHGWILFACSFLLLIGLFWVL